MTLSIQTRLAANLSTWLPILTLKMPWTLQRSACMDTLRKFYPHHPAWLDVVGVILARSTVMGNPTADKPSRTWDGFPQEDPLSTLLFSRSWVSHVRSITSEVHVASFADDTILAGPAGEITKALQQLPALLQPTGLELQPAKTQIWVPRSECLKRAPLLQELRNKVKDPRAQRSGHLGRGHGSPDGWFLSGGWWRLRHWSPPRCGGHHHGWPAQHCSSSRQIAFWPSRVFRLLGPLLPPKDGIEQGSGPSAWQSVQPISWSKMGLRPGRVLSW